jgi:hypothetical protein
MLKAAMKCSKIKKCWLAAFYLDEKMTAPNLPTRLEESFLSKKARLRRVAGLNHKTTCCRQLDKGKPLYALLSTKLHITHGLLQPCRQQSNCKSGRNFFNFFFAIA